MSCKAAKRALLVIKIQLTALLFAMVYTKVIYWLLGRKMNHRQQGY